MQCWQKVFARDGYDLLWYLWLEECRHPKVSAHWTVSSLILMLTAVIDDFH